jgi:hypothetical protein
MSISGFDLIGKCFKLGCKDGDARRLEERLRDADEVIAFYSSNIVVVIGSDNEILEEDNERAREYQSKYLTALNS